MPSNTKPRHAWSEPDESGISSCLDCPCVRRIEGKAVRLYKPRKTSDWIRTIPPCMGAKREIENPRATRKDQRAKT